MEKIWYLIFSFYFSLTSKLKQKQKIYFQKKVEKSCKSYIPPLRVNGYTIVSKQTYLGKNVNFNGMIIRGKGEVKIGDNFHSGIGCSMLTSFHNFNEGNKIPYDETTINKDIVIEDNVWLGNDVIILGGVTIGEGAIIQAGSVIVSNIPKCTIAGGHPAKVFSKRDIEHYERLKAEKKFH